LHLRVLHALGVLVAERVALLVERERQARDELVVPGQRVLGLAGVLVERLLQDRVLRERDAVRDQRASTTRRQRARERVRDIGRVAEPRVADTERAREAEHVARGLGDLGAGRARGVAEQTDSGRARLEVRLGGAARLAELFERDLEPADVDVLDDLGALAERVVESVLLRLSVCSEPDSLTQEGDVSRARRRRARRFGRHRPERAREASRFALSCASDGLDAEHGCLDAMQPALAARGA
jgi:hypothetical protein